MAFTANAIGRVRPSGSDLNGAFFDHSLLTLTDLAATSATTTAPVVTSASYTFVAGDVGDYVFIKSGTNWTPGWYAIASVSAGAATLTATIGSVRLFSGDYCTFNTVAGCATTGSPTGGTFGVDYTQINAATGAVSDYTSTAATTITTATGAASVSWIGNAIRLSSGTGVTTGYYFITAVASATSFTVDRASGTYTAGVGKVGGGAATFQRLCNSSNATGDKVVAGNTVFIYGSGSDSPSSADYTFTGFTTVAGGTTAAGFTRLIGENGRPRLQGDGCICYNSTLVHFENLYFTSSGTSSASSGIVNFNNTGSVKNCVLNLNAKAGLVGIYCNNAASRIIDTEIYGGVIPATFSAGAYGIHCNNIAATIDGCNIHHCRDNGIHVTASNTAGTTIVNSKITKNAGDGIYIAGTTYVPHKVSQCTIDGNLLHGVNVASSAAMVLTSIINCNITNHTVASKYGLNIGAGTAALNDNLKSGMINYNNFYNNTFDRNNISASPNDRAVDPGYIDATNGNYAMGTALKGLGFPGLLRNSAASESAGTTLYIDIGAQRQEAGGGGGGGPLVDGRLVR